MTGTLFKRQHSSSAGYTNVDKLTRSALRRSLSANYEHVADEIPNDNECKEKPSIKCDRIPSDADSGVEDSDQNGSSCSSSQADNIDEKEPSTDFGACADEDLKENTTPVIPEPSTNSVPQNVDPINKDFGACVDKDFLDRVAKVPHDEKKYFCDNTMWVFHGEHARLIHFPVRSRYPWCNYYLLPENEVGSDPRTWDGYVFEVLNNAKAQFQCSNIYCRHVWTSMRARISFVVSRPQKNGFVVLKIYRQGCEECKCGVLEDAIWYMEEVCRVMEDLRVTIFNRYFPDTIKYENLQSENVHQNNIQRPQRLRYNDKQRQGNMGAPHEKFQCEACQYNRCYQ
ncbi:unnamed protein product [Adineta steineri]|uniref:3CxxC-type domain-containing protein n=1 Tax=Adineta steineri TaxID=433720 RepID=A0A818ZG80_9BILA|nr:unnamed protein product [Adineta steineri]CAF3769108.1 unnamed protein product [Adineta steineri]